MFVENTTPPLSDSEIKRYLEEELYSKPSGPAR